MKLSLPERFAGRPRTMLWIVAVLVVSLTMMIVAVSFLLSATVANGIREGIEQEAGEVAQLAAEGIDPETGQAFTTAARFIEVYVGRQSSERGELLAAGAEGLPEVLEVQGRDAGSLADLDEDTRRRVLTPGTSGVLQSATQGRITWESIPVIVGETQGFVTVLEFHASRNAELNRSILTLTLLAVATLVVTGGIVWWVSGRIGEPTERFTEAVAAYRPGEGLRVPERGSDSYARLARIANRMIGHAEDAVAEEKRQQGETARRLRDRLDTVAELVVGLPAGGTTALIRDELSTLQRATVRLEQLSELAVEQGVRREPGMDVNEIVAAAVASWTAHSVREKTVHVLAVGDRPVIGSCDPDRLTQALYELIDNAVDASEAGTTVRVGCFRAKGRSGAAVVMAVQDAGRGVPDGEKDAVLESFVVASNDPAPGSGLGLTLARALARSQGGRVVVDDAHPGPGTAVRIELPLAAPEAPTAA